MPAEPIWRRYLRFFDACEYAQIGKTKMYEIAREGFITVKKSGARTLVDLDSLDAYLAALPPLREMQIRERGRRKRKRRGPQKPERK